LTESISPLSQPDFAGGTATACASSGRRQHKHDWHAWEKAGNVYGRQDHRQGVRLVEQRRGRPEKRPKAMGQNAHRMSVEWSRIEPREGHWDTAAIDRYPRHTAMHEAIHDLETDGPRSTISTTYPLAHSSRRLGESRHHPLLRNASQKDGRELFGEYYNLWITLNEGPSSIAILGWLGGVPRNEKTAPIPHSRPVSMISDLPSALLENLFPRPCRSVPCALHRNWRGPQVGIGHNIALRRPPQ